MKIQNDQKNPLIKRRIYMIPFLDSNEKMRWVKLNATSYKNALIVAGCIFDNAENKVFYKDFTIVD